MRTMVADTKVSHGEGRFTSSKKIQRVGNFIVGVAGDYGPALTYLKIFEKAARSLDGKIPPKLPAYEGEFEMLILSARGLWLSSQDGSTIEVEEDFYFVGTGGSFAGAALRCQELTLQPCNLEVAMEVACEFDDNSALPMVTLSLPPPGTKPAAKKARPVRHLA